jgi:hypothetical protein
VARALRAARAAAMPAARHARSRAARLVLLAAVALCSHAAHAFPLFYNANGSAMLTSTNGADVVLQPDGAGALHHLVAS